MFGQSADDIIRREVESVRARRVILDQLEGGPKSGSELRESIRKDMMAQTVRTRGKRVRPDEFRVSDPKLYFNTRHLESLGIITSVKRSQQRIFSLNPHVVQAVRRVLGIERPKCMVTSLGGPEDQRRLMRWVFRDSRFAPRVIHVVVEGHRFSKGVAKNLERYVPDDRSQRWEGHWHELPDDIVGRGVGASHGDLSATYSEIERLVLDALHDHEVVVNLTYGPPLITMALALVALDYSLTAVFLEGLTGDRPDIVVVLPRGGGV